MINKQQMIEIENLSFSYDKQEILSNINTHFSSGKFSVILGRNGSGKSTLFSIMAGLQKRYSGSIHISGTERKQVGLGKDSKVRIGFLPQFHQTTFPFSVKDVVLTGRASFFKLSPSAQDMDAVEEILKRFDLWHYRDKPYTSLSGGERQLVLLSRVLVQKPDILMLDEPTNHLDLYYQVAVLKCIRSLVDEGTTVLCVMHDPNMAFMYGDEIFVMKDKKLLPLQDKQPEDIKQILELTYSLPLLLLDNQGKLMFMPSIQ